MNRRLLRTRKGTRSGGAKRLTYANVVSTLCLFLLLGGGTAYAAHEVINGSDVVDGSLTGADVQDNSLGAADLGTNSVGFDELANNAVGSTSQIVDGTVRSADVRDATLTGVDIADGSLTQADLATNSVAYDELAPGAVGAAFQIEAGVLHSFHAAADFMAPNADRLDGLDSSEVQRRNLWAAVSEAGALQRGYGVSSVRREVEGQYVVTFNRSVSACAWTATAAPHQVNYQGTVLRGPGWLNISPGDTASSLRVHVWSPVHHGAPFVREDLPFHLLITC